jgi:hypothetical protein
MATLQGGVQHVFTDVPNLVAIAVIAMELRRRLALDQGLPDTSKRAPAPKLVVAMESLLEEFAPTFVQLCARGLSLEESVS